MPHIWTASDIMNKYMNKKVVLVLGRLIIHRKILEIHEKICQ